MKPSLIFFDKFYLVALFLLIPTSLNLSITQFLIPILNSFMGRTLYPELSISAFSITISILFFLALPQLRIQQLTIVYYKNFDKNKIHFFVVLLSFISLVLTVLVIFTPIINFLLESIFGTKNELREQIENSLRISFFIPFLLIIKMHFYAIAIVSYKSNYIWIGTIFGLLVNILFASILFFFKVDKYNLGIASFSISTILETFLIFFLVRNFIFDNKYKINRGTIKIGSLGKFFAPLLFAAFIPSFTMPALNACLARFDNPEIAISSVNVGFGIFGAVTFTINGCQSTILSLLSNGYEYIKIRNFSYAVGFVTLIICFIFSWVDPITNLIFSDLIGLEEDLLKSTIYVFRILSFLPPFLVMEQIYVGIIMNSKSTNPIFYINICRFLVLLICLTTGILFLTAYGPTVGGAAWAITLFFEAIFAWFFARNLLKP